jgi:hypothetical protein
MPMNPILDGAKAGCTEIRGVGRSPIDFYRG